MKSAIQIYNEYTGMELCLVHEDETSSTYFHSQHYIDVRKRRKELGLPVERKHPDEAKYIEKYIGKVWHKFSNNADNLIESVHVQWQCGWHVNIVYRHGKSHGMSCIENINCLDPVILRSIIKNNVDFIVYEG